MLCLVCLFSLLLGQVQSNNLVLTAQQDELMFARLGENVTLGCTVEGADLGTWYYNNIPLEQVTVAAENGRTLVELEIRNVQMSNAGWYTCVASTDRERIERDFLLVVGGEPRLETRAPDPYIVQRGTRVELPCFVLGTPRPSIMWFDNAGRQIYDGHGEKYKIDATTNSLVIFNVDDGDRDRGPFSCRVSNQFGNRSYDFSFDFASVNSPNVISPEFHSDFNPSSDTVLAFQPGPEITLTCHSNASLSYKWLKNGKQKATSRTYNIHRNESGFYCCEILESGIINTHCVTVFFRFAPEFRSPTTPASASLPTGRVANLLCRAATSDASINYDPPPLVWNSSVDTSGVIRTNFTDEYGLAYVQVEMQEGSSGTYSCAGGNFMKAISRDTELRSVDLGGTNHMYIRNGLAERGSESNGWITIGNASLTTFRNERIFMVSSDSSNAVIKQTLSIPQGVESIYLRGRMRQSEALAQGSSYPIIRLGYSGTTSIIAIPFPTSEAWQWVGERFLTNRSTNMLIELTIMTANASGLTKREATEGVAFFDDISVSFPGVCPDNQFVCSNGDCAASEGDCEDEASSDQDLIIIVAGAGGGAVLILLVAIVTVLCCCCCLCRRDKKSGAQPMRKISTFMKKTRYQRPVPPIPLSYTHTGTPNPQSPTSEGGYATLKGDSYYTQATALNIPEAQSPESDAVYTSLRGDIGSTVETYYSNTEFSTQSQEKGQKENGGSNLYTALDPTSLNEDTYYSSTNPTTLPQELTSSPVRGVANEDVGGVDLYLEVLPSAPSHSSREASPNPITSPTSISSKAEREGKSHPEHFDPTTGEVYEYVNTDLGPN